MSGLSEPCDNLQASAGLAYSASRARLSAADRIRHTCSYTLSTLLHTSLLLLPLRCTQQHPRPPAVPVHRIELAPAAARVTAAAPRPQQRAAAPDPAEPTAAAEPEREPLPRPDLSPDRSRFVRVEQPGASPEEARFISAHSASTRQQTQARPETLHTGPPVPAAPSSAGSATVPGQGEAPQWEPLAVRVTEREVGGLPAPERPERQPAPAGSTDAAGAADEHVPSPREQDPRRSAAAAEGAEPAERIGAATSGALSPAAGTEREQAGLSSAPRPEAAPREPSDAGEPTAADPLAGADSESADQPLRDGRADADIEPVPEGPEAERAAAGGAGSASRGGPPGGSPAAVAERAPSDGLDRARAPASGDQQAGSRETPAAEQLYTGADRGEASLSERRPRAGQPLEAAATTSGPEDRAEAAPDSAGSPGTQAHMGVLATSPPPVGSQDLPIERETAVNAVATELGTYFFEVEAILRERWKVPRELIYMGAQGTTRVVVAIAPGGAITERRVVRMSGYQGLDDAAVAAFPRRLPRPPDSAPSPLYLAFDFTQRDDWVPGLQ